MSSVLQQRRGQVGGNRGHQPPAGGLTRSLFAASGQTMIRLSAGRAGQGQWDREPGVI